MSGVLYIDCACGISGDMLNAALIDAGASLNNLIEMLETLPLKGFTVSTQVLSRCGVRALKFDVSIEERDTERRYSDIVEIIFASGLDPSVKSKALRIFRSIFEAESRVHGTSLEETHLHELGAIDCIIDICSASINLSHLGIEKIISSPVNIGGGRVKTAHGLLPVPAPATAELLKGIPVYSSGINYELTTPTGAAILKEIASDFSSLPMMTIESIGCGAGGGDIPDIPNILRVFLGGGGEYLPADTITVIETNIDDMSPQIYDYVMERIFSAGALDLFITPIIMKKGRPAIKLTALCRQDNAERITRIILSETTSIGVRRYEAGRTVLDRREQVVTTEYGGIGVKVSSLHGEVLNAAPEYEDCKAAAKRHNVALKLVIEAACKEFKA